MSSECDRRCAVIVIRARGVGGHVLFVESASLRNTETC